MNDDVMDLPILNFNNYEVHPTEKNYMVFFFAEEDASRHFEILLAQNNISFEKDETENYRKRFLFGVKKRDFKKVSKLNDLTKGLYRKRTIANKITGNSILIITVSIILLAIFGYFFGGN